LLALGLLGLWSFAAPQASAQATETVRGRVFNETEVDGDRVRQPVEGVTITVATVDGEAVDETATDAEGRYEIPLPGPGNFVVTLDESSLPDGVTPREDSPSERTVNVRPGENQALNFFLGESGRKSTNRWTLLPQTIANGVKFGLIIAICAVGLSLIYGTTGLSNFAHGEIVALGAIMAWYANQYWFRFHVLLAALVGIAASTLAAGAFERGIFRPLRRRGVGLTSLMIVTIGVGISARYVFQFIFGGRSRAYRQFVVQKAEELPGPLSVSLTPRSMTIMLISVVAAIGVALWLLRTRTGKAIRAVSDNPDLASSTGINTDRIILIVWVVGGALAGLGGILLGLEQQVRWDMGFSLLLLMFAAITLGGLGNPFGALVGGVVIGVFVELWTWILPGVIELKNIGALLALILILLIRPQGILGRKERVG
jgi:branched-chain amino acid transport system permease protein